MALVAGGHAADLRPKRPDSENASGWHLLNLQDPVLWFCRFVSAAFRIISFKVGVEVRCVSFQICAIGEAVGPEPSNLLLDQEFGRALMLSDIVRRL